MRENVPLWYLKMAAVFAAAAFALALAQTAFAGSGHRFPDIEGHWAETAIVRAVEAGYASGYEDGAFRPDGQVSRAEFAVMLAGALHIPAAGPEENGNGEEAEWFRPCIDSLLDVGLVLPGETDDRAWTDPLNRAEMARLAVRAAAAGRSGPAGDWNLGDRSVQPEAGEFPSTSGMNGREAPSRPGQNAESFLQAAAALGMMEAAGTAGSAEAALKEAVTRAQAVTVIERVLRLLNNRADQG